MLTANTIEWSLEHLTERYPWFKTRLCFVLLGGMDVATV